MNERAQRCKELAQKARAEMLYLTKYANSTMHWGGSFSSVEIFSVLYSEILNCREETLDFSCKDKFLLSKGHAALGLYTVMHQVGLLTDEQMRSYQQDGSYISELMEARPELGFETSGGSLGINLSYAVGLALLAKRKNYTYKTYIEVGDGEIDEGAVWEAIMAASQYKLDNLVLIVDANTVQSDGFTKDIMSWANLDERLNSFGWYVRSIDGHDCEQLLFAFERPHVIEKPLAIIANTIKGKGVSFMENNYLWHDRIMSRDELEIAREEVNVNVDFEY